MKTMGRLIAAAGVFLSAAYLHAGAQCRLLGTVTDSSGAPVEGVTVVVTTPSLRTFKTSVKTDGKGKYSMVLNDCTMPYHVSFEKEGFVTAGEDKKIPINDQGTVDMKLLKTSEAKPAPGAPGAPVAAPQPSATDKAVSAFNAGVDAMNGGDKATAEAKFQESVKNNPDLPAGWQALATLAYEKKDYARTLEYGEKAVDLDPTLTNIYPMLSDAAKATGDKKAAADWASKYAEANPDSPEILFNKGIDAYNKGKMKDAEALLTKAVDAKPDFANAQFYLGMASFNLNHKASAKEHLQKYIELEPNGKEAGTVKEILPLLK
ncbi:MAG TPA: tetratricopeptide repeat protein [Thermoanaerobaculia bacterium]|nr:tetratricopeptide repeat protein [Thermoanaerobaculia bacterium]